MSAVLSGVEVSSAAVAELLSTLIRNRCVSHGYPSVGTEIDNAAVLRSVLEGSGADIEWFEAVAGRPSLVARIPGSDPEAPTLCLLGHTDVVPADPEGWTFDPFGGEITAAEVRGRGAVDMLNQTAAMALVMAELAETGFSPRGDLLFWAAPDEECGGHQGAGLLLQQAPDLVRADAVITEVGGARTATPNGPIIEGYAAEKGAGALAITVRGDAGHTSLPHGHRNAVVVASEVVRRLESWEPTVRISAPWRMWVEERYEPGAVRDALLDATSLDEMLSALPPDEAAHAHACTRCTLAPTIIQGGEKVNTFPETVRIGVNVRATWGDDCDAIVEELRRVLCDLVAPEDVVALGITKATRSPIDTDLWSVLSEVSAELAGATLVPSTLAAQTDARWLRPRGITTYGFGLLSAAVDRQEYWSRFHGVDERIDLDSLGLLAAGYEAVIRRFCAA
ncbi:MAG: M20/M25/M40 family metallo-hydrolase [Mycobacteriales bacterium]